MKPLRNDPLPKKFFGDTERLVEMLSYIRPAGSLGEEVFLDTYVRPFEKDPNVVYSEDRYGNILIRVGKAPTTFFTAHTDTMHSDPYNLLNPKQQQLDMYSPYHPYNRGSLDDYTLVDIPTDYGHKTPPIDDPKDDEELDISWFLQDLCYDARSHTLWKNDGDCLGADDGTGVWILINMIEAGIEGLYAFFREEELGRRGSEWLLENFKEELEKQNLKHCISFDRKGNKDVITKQRGRTCCSDAFAKALSEALNESKSLNYAPCPNGSFTDSATFTEIIPECTNIAVGYQSQHTANEKQNILQAHQLLEQLLKINWGVLPSERDPNEPPPEPAYGMYGYGNYGYGYGYTPFDQCTLYQLINRHPEKVYDALRYLGITADEIRVIHEKTKGAG